MVMHARKHPRLNNDGYYDRKDSHPYQNAQYPSKSHQGVHTDRYDRRDSPSFRNRDDSPTSRRSPRYSNKSSYIDRNREKLQQGSSGSPGDRRSNHYAGGSSNSNGSGNGRGGKVGKEMGLGGPGGQGGQKDQKDRDYRAEVHKSAVGWSGNWSEHISSSGKKYYYNCSSEVSQWEKPKEWIVEQSGSRMSDIRPKDIRPGNSKPGPHTSNKSSSDRGRHSSGGDRDQLYRPINRTAFSASTSTKTDVDKPTSHYTGGGGSGPHAGGQLPRTDYPFSNSSGPSGSGAWGNPPHQASHMDNSHAHNKDSQYRRYYGLYSSSQTSSYSGGGKHERRDSEGNRSLSVTGHYSRSTDRRGSENERRYSQHSEADMDISPSTSPPYGRQNSRHASSNTPVHPPTSTPVSVTTPSRVNAHTPGGAAQPTCIPTSSPVIGSLPQLITQLSPTARANLSNNQDQEFAQKAFQTLQKLQEALSRQLAKAAPCQSPARSTLANTEALSQNPLRPPVGIHQALTGLVTSGHNSLMATGMGSLPLAQVFHQQTASHDESIEKGRETPRSEKSVRSGSPTPSISSTMEAPLGTSALSAAGMRQAVPQLTPSLANHYNEKLISHVQGWQADHAERQANRYMEEYVNIGSVLCQQVSVELKRARSLVRLAAIQSTLQEQRCAAINALKNQ